MDIACTLTGTHQTKQRERWNALRGRFGLERRDAADGLRLTFEDHPQAETELQALVAVENDCCAWADWTVERADGILVMAARSEGDGIATLHTMFKM
ncbi:MAG TPA: hypothetical protein VGF66_10445 [Gaiellaceae bacterium]|jgi:hypothetical protein